MQPYEILYRVIDRTGSYKWSNTVNDTHEPFRGYFLKLLDRWVIQQRQRQLHGGQSRGGRGKEWLESYRKAFCLGLSVKQKKQMKAEKKLILWKKLSFPFLHIKEECFKTSKDYNYTKHDWMMTTGGLLLSYLIGSGVWSSRSVMSEMIMPFEYTSAGDASSCPETQSRVTSFQCDRNQATFITKQHCVWWSDFIIYMLNME